MEGRDGNEHDGAHKGTENVFDDDGYEVPSSRTSRWEEHDDTLSEDGGNKSAHKRPTPDPDRLVLLAPFARVVTQAHFEGEVDQNSECQVFLAKPLVQELEVSDGVISLEANLGDEVDDNEDLDVLESENSTHDFVDIPDSFLLLGPVFLLQDGESKSHGQVEPAPKGEIGVEGHKSDIEGLRSKVFIRKVGRVQGEEDGKG